MDVASPGMIRDDLVSGFIMGFNVFKAHLSGSSRISVGSCGPTEVGPFPFSPGARSGLSFLSGRRALSFLLGTSVLLNAYALRNRTLPFPPLPADKFTTTARPAPWVHTVQGRSAVVQGSEVCLQRLADKSVRPHIKP